MATSIPTFTAGGLASGLDTNSIVDKLVALETLPVTKNTTQQAALTVQISSIADLSSKIKSLDSSATSLALGVATNSISSTPSGITAVAGTGAQPGRYTIAVSDLAIAAKARSAQFTSPNDKVGGALNLHVKGVAVTINITANSDLGSVVKQINQSGAPVTAAVISDGSKFYVSLSNKETGKPIGSGVTGGLVIDSDTTGLGLAVTQDAVNAALTVDGLPVESQSNQITTAIPGVTLNVVAKQAVASDLVIGADPSKSLSKLQGFVDSFNAIMTALAPSLKPDPNARPAAGSTLDGVLAYGLERRLHGMLSSKVVALGAHRTLADIGVKLQNDGTVTIDSALFNDAVAKDPTGVDAIFSTPTTGIATQMTAFSKSYTDSVDGQLVQRQTSLKTTIKDLQKTNQRLTDHVTAYKAQLQAQFARMESLIANYNSIGSYLSARDKSSSSK